MSEAKQPRRCRTNSERHGSNLQNFNIAQISRTRSGGCNRCMPASGMGPDGLRPEEQGEDRTVAQGELRKAYRLAGRASRGQGVSRSSSFDDKHGFVVNQGLVAVLSEMVILLYCVIQQCIANVPSRLSVVFAQNRFK